jgi:hypothetical protein
LVNFIKEKDFLPSTNTNAIIIGGYTMEKKSTILILGLFTVLIAVFATSASAWHCTDTDQSKPIQNRTTHKYGPWGNNGLLGGSALGWMASSVALPEGCTGAWNNANCTDYCKGTDLVEFYCTDRPYVNGETVITSAVYKNSAQCNEVPEFTSFPIATLGIAGAVVGFLFLRKRK